MATELNTRQLFGEEYTQPEREGVATESTVKRTGVDFSLEFHGKAKNPPEMEMLTFFQSPKQAVVIFHDLDKFKIKHTATGKELDLLAATPSNWSQKCIKLTGITYKAQEIIMAFTQH